MANIFTIGYSAFGIDEFIDELQKNSIVCVVDVRSNPVSGEYYKDYNGYNLEKILKQHDISRDFLCIFLLITMFFPIFRFVFIKWTEVI